MISALNCDITNFTVCHKEYLYLAIARSLRTLDFLQGSPFRKAFHESLHKDTLDSRRVTRINIKICPCLNSEVSPLNYVLIMVLMLFHKSQSRVPMRLT